MKKVLALIVGLCLLLSFLLCGCSDTTENDDLGDSLITTSEYSLRFIEGKCEYYHDDEYLMLFFELTNTSGKTAVPEDLVSIAAFQNGVELTMITFNGQRIDDAIVIDVSIQNGATTTVVWMFYPDDYSDVSVETSDGQAFTVELIQGQELLSSGQHSANYTCIVGGCSNKGSIKYDGLSGNTEYYCSTHYDELLETMKEIMEEDSQLYKYSEYIKEEYLRDELLEWFSKYNIRYYDESVVEEFVDMDLPKPETAIANYPSYAKEDGSYLYGFDGEEECRVYLSAYMVYLMNFDYEVTDIGNNVYSIDNEYYIGLGKIDGKYCFMIVEL